VKEQGRVAGVVLRDAEHGAEFTLRARVVVNATGVFTDTIRRFDEPTAKPLVVPSQGAHLVLDRSFLPGNSALMVPKTDDGRVLFAIPWHGHVVVGTTDGLRADIPLEPRPLAEEVSFLLEHAGRYLSRQPKLSDIRSVFAGLRPLFGGGGGKTSGISREHALVVSDSKLVTITGGKWTTYRAMAEQTVDRAEAVGGLDRKPCRTRELQLHGAGEVFEVSEPRRVYGTDAAALAQLIASRPEWARPLHERFRHVAGEVVWAVRHEMARTVEDVLARRLRMLFLDALAALEAAPLVAELLAGELGRDEAWRQQQVREFTELARGYLPATKLPNH
jgi:glycerol-3-phosphate dehydrogenase